MVELLGHVTGASAALDRNLLELAAPGAQSNVGGVPGVYGGTECKVSVGTGMRVNVAPGRVSVPAGASWEGTYLGLVKATTALTLAPAHATLYRTDLIVAQVDDTYYGDGVTEFTLGVVTGTPSSSNPSAVPAVPTRATALAEVRVNPGATSPSLIVERRYLARERRLRYVATGNTPASGSYFDLAQQSWTDVPGVTATWVTPPWASMVDVTLLVQGFYGNNCSSNPACWFQMIIAGGNSPTDQWVMLAREQSHKQKPYRHFYRRSCGPPGSSQVYKLQAKMAGYPGSLRADTSSHWWMSCEFLETLV